MNKKYNHLDVEKGKNQEWIEKKIFECNKYDTKKNFSIILPPPNVTGKLHLGHAWDSTLQDILIRYKKLKGYNTMWIPGMDHAGIATQAKVEERLAKDEIYRKDITRDFFLEKSWQWKEEYAQNIKDQWGKLGLALDYSKEKFTLDEDINQQVKSAFVKLYNKGLIYQGTRIINWDPKAQTALSDIEVEHKEVVGNFYTLKYYLEDKTEYLEVATTRPETIFGDSALAINPSDKRANKFIGENVIVPGTDKIIPIIGDDYVEMDFGTGIVKITPAHDPNDYNVGTRHNLEQTIVMNLDGSMNEKCYEYSGLDRFECRKQLIKNLNALNLVVEIKEHVHNVGHSERTNVIVEPLLSKQWFLKADVLAKQALEFQENKKVEFYPKRFEQTYLTWMENLHDWCISRQLWWGHQIPVYYHKITGEMVVSDTEIENIEDYIQDEDVLDTWFSSALWPFSTQSEDMKNIFYPTSTLVTGYDIIFFWVSRMIFQGIEFEKNIPFEKVLIHGLVRAEDGKKMSKSLGNGIDPMDVIEEYGADALRYFLSTNSTPGQDLRFSKEKIESSWNYINKIWNISNFVLSNIEDIKNEKFKIINLNDSDKYIIEKLNTTITYIDIMMEKYEFTEVAAKLYTFIWDDFASWYIEVSKVALSEENNLQTKLVLKKVLEDILIMLHPFMPFVTEEIYSNLSDKLLVEQKYPQITDIDCDNNFSDIQEIIITLRNFKAENEIKPSKEIEVGFENINSEYFSQISKEMLSRFGKIKKITNNLEIENKTTYILKNLILNINMEGLISGDDKLEKFNQQKKKLVGELVRSQKMLSNEKFIFKASKEKVDLEYEKANNYFNQYNELIDKYKNYIDIEKEKKEVEKLGITKKEIK